MTLTGPRAWVCKRPSSWDVAVDCDDPLNRLASRAICPLFRSVRNAHPSAGRSRRPTIWRHPGDDGRASSYEMLRAVLRLAAVLPY